MKNFKSFATKNHKAINIIVSLVVIAGMVVFGRSEFFMSNPALSIIAGVSTAILVRVIFHYTKPVTAN
jgi:hypothetical protein